MKKFSRIILGVLLAFTSLAAKPITPNQVWDIAYVNYRAVEGVCLKKPVSSTMSNTEFTAIVSEQQQAVALIKQWNPSLNFRAQWVERPLLSKVRSLGDGSCWASWQDVDYVTGVDSMFVTIDPKNDLTGTYWYIWGGLSIICGDCVNQAGYSTASGNTSLPEDWRINRDIYEWLHPTAAWFRENKAYVAPPGDMTRYGFTSDREYYKAVVSGTLPDLNGDGHSDGITDWHIEKAGTPTGN